MNIGNRNTRRMWAKLLILTVLATGLPFGNLAASDTVYGSSRPTEGESSYVAVKDGRMNRDGTISNLGERKMTNGGGAKPHLPALDRRAATSTPANQGASSLDIVRGGQANAIVVVDDTVYPEEPAAGPEQGVIHGWTQAYGKGNIAVTDAVSHTGNYSLHFNDGDSSAYGVLSDLVEISEGETYTVSAMVYRASGDDPQIFIRFYDQNKVRIGGQPWLRVPGTGAYWTEASVAGTAPAQAAYAAAGLYTGVPQASVYFDDIQLRSVSGNVPLANPGFEPQTPVRRGPAETLVDYVRKSTGALLPIMTEPEYGAGGGGEPEQVLIRIGTTESVYGNAPALDALLSTLDGDGFVIYPQGQTITIAGPTVWGTTNGVYGFLERYADIRWLMPGPDGEDVPPLSELSAGRGIVREQPAFGFRVFSPLHGKPDNSADAIQELNIWAQRNRLQGFYNAPVSFHHNMYNLFSVSKFGATHPEFYPNGQPPGANSISGWQPCFSNPDTVDAAVEEILAYFRDNPDAQSYSLGINDGNGYCESNPIPVYYDWVNRVVDRVLAVHPDKWFGLLAYQSVIRPPSFPLNPRVIPFLTKDRMAWADPDAETLGYADEESWLQVAGQIGYYDYIYGSPYLVPRVYPHQMAETLLHARERGIGSYYAELYPNWGEGPKAWLASKLLWDPEQDVDALLQEWYTRAVGVTAATYLKQYYDHWEFFWTERAILEPWFLPGTIYQNFADPGYLNAVTEEDISLSREWLEAVVAAAETEPQKARANLLLRAFEYYEASALSYPRIGERPADTASALALLEYSVNLFGERIEMAGKRFALLDEFKSNPVLLQYMDARRFNQLIWSGWNAPEFWALVDYMKEREDAGGPVRLRASELAATHPSPEGRQYAALMLQALSRPSAVQNPSFEDGDEAAPPWELLSRSTSSRSVRRAEGTAFTGTVSMQVYGKGWGGPSQVIVVEPGLASMSFRYHIPQAGNTAGSIQWGFDLLDDQGEWINFSTVRSPVTSLADAESQWLEARLDGEIPQTINGKQVRQARLIVLVSSTEPVEVYVDDFKFYSMAKP
ncbi:DUF4838 domain-containing protein [Paenibacillus hemerocallicola]|uniref:DUF4838 domain-containing protein n=1 Tax=Paenibacillus hemerocallicola TaxID=1172614 RepID=A0A5C4THD6_9BACL|nr:DUF4838 domain-containing protein [Paenibacillus hemerocallicola]TNJ67839.1 DUF4838 domain-containing protein [Paenibacillus hemerocallicola]